MTSRAVSKKQKAEGSVFVSHSLVDFLMDGPTLALGLCVFEDAKTPRTKDQIIARYRGRTDRRVNSVEPARLSVFCSSHFTTIGGRD